MNFEENDDKILRYREDNVHDRKIHRDDSTKKLDIVV